MGTGTLLVAAQILSLFVSLEAKAQERTWKTKDGKYSVKAEFVELTGDAIKLKRADTGIVVTVPLSKLSDADRKFVSSMDKSDEEKSNTKTEASKSDLKITGKLAWSKFANFDDDGKELPRDLQLMIEAKGKAAEDAVEYGFVELKKCLSNVGEMTVKENKFKFDDATKKYVKVTRSDNKMMSDHPKNGVRVTFDFENPGNDVKKFAEVEGSFKIRTGGTREKIEIADAVTMIDKNFEHEKFDSLGVEVTVEKEEKTLSLKLNGNHQPIVAVQLANPKGKKLKGQMGSGWSGGGDLMSYDFQFEDEIPANATFFVTSPRTSRK